MSWTSRTSRIAAVTEQYLEYIAVLEQIDVDAVGDFLEMASSLIEIKSRMVLPGEEEVEDELEDPRQELVRRLLEYKQYRDAASMLEERSRGVERAVPTPGERFAVAADFARAAADSRGGAMGPGQRVRPRAQGEARACAGPESIRYDETPIHVYMQRIDERVRRDGRVAFTAFFETAVHKSTLVGMFLAVLELVRHQHARAAQPELFGEIWLEPGDEAAADGGRGGIAITSTAQCRGLADVEASRVEG